MSKQDRQGVRKASDIEQKYNLALLNQIGESSKRDNEQISKLTQALSQFIVETNNKLFPVGTVHITLTESNPSEVYGGEWELLKEGKIVVDVAGKQETSDDTCYIWKRTS